MIRYRSNKRPIGDGVRITRVSGSGQILEVLTDPKTMTWSEIELVTPINLPMPATPVTLTFKVP